MSWKSPRCKEAQVNETFERLCGCPICWFVDRVAWLDLLVICPAVEYL